MDETTSPSLMFKGMLEMNPNFRRADGGIKFLSPEGAQLLQGLTNAARVAIISLQVTDFFPLTAACGEETSFVILDLAMDTMTREFPSYFKDCPLIHTERVGFGDIILFLELPPDPAQHPITSFSEFRLKVLDSFSRRVTRLTITPVSISLGFARIDPDPSEPFSKAAFKAYCEAQRSAKSRSGPVRPRLHDEFLDLIRRRALHSVFQPILDFKDGSILGWEALVRGPEQSSFQDPINLFNLAEEVGETIPLDRICRAKAIESVGPLLPGQKMFLNIHPMALTDPLFTPPDLKRMLEARDIEPSSVVLEFSEKRLQADLNLFLRRIDPCREAGFQVAIDDVGAGDSSLRALSQIRPDYIKSDLSLTSSIDSNPFKRIMVETLVLLSEKFGGIVVAEGIEATTELSSLISMGVHAGQGFLFAKPSMPKPMPEVSLPARSSFRDMSSDDWKCSTPVIELLQTTLTVAPTDTVRDVKILLEDKPPMSSVVVVKDERPLGLIMNYNLDRHLGTRFGISLYYHREVSRLMDASPLVVSADLPVEDVAKAAMNRQREKIYDDIVIARDGLYLGTVSVQRMLDTLAQVQVELAKGSNPLTGLPGNVAIEQELNRRSRAKIQSSLIYVDLDNFKIYNDVYGFQSGDKVILHTAKILKDALRAVGKPDDFLGHVGGDDFTVISARDRSEIICKEVVESFSREIGSFYNEEDRTRGYILGRGRDGREGKFPLISVSLGIVDCDFKMQVNLDELSHRVAEVKKFAKSQPGNSYVRDRRTPLGAES